MWDFESVSKPIGHYYFDLDGNDRSLHDAKPDMHMYPEHHEETHVIAGSVIMGYEIYPTLPGIELAVCSLTSARRLH